MAREASVERNTKETEIKLKINLDGTGYSDIETGVGFFNHMLDGFTRHGLFDLSVRAVSYTHLRKNPPDPCPFKQYRTSPAGRREIRRQGI